MFLFEYLIKLLLGNSSTLFMGLFVVIFGYYGWLLWNINSELKLNIEENIKQGEQVRKNGKELEKIYDFLDRDIFPKLKQIEDDIGRLDLEKTRNSIIDEIKEESAEVKETIKILLSRSLNMKPDDFLKIVKPEKEQGNNIDRQT
ncbi:MAG: hypothetical protein ACOCQN_02885 [Halanaerobiaceae bacterium]